MNNYYNYCEKAAAFINVRAILFPSLLTGPDSAPRSRAANQDTLHRGNGAAPMEKQHEQVESCLQADKPGIYRLLLLLLLKWIETEGGAARELSLSKPEIEGQLSLCYYQRKRAGTFPLGLTPASMEDRLCNYTKAERK